MPEQIKPIAVIKAEAERAAQVYSDVNDACPYPFFSDAGHAFKAAFCAARAALEASQTTEESAAA